MKRYLSIVILLFCTFSLWSAPGNNDLVNIQITPNHYDWNYKVGEPVKFTITLFQDQQKLKDIKAWYEIGPEKMPPTQKDSVSLKGGSAIIKADGMKKPGFLSCVIRVSVDGICYRKLISVAYDCNQIRPTTTLPDDFMSFWSGQIKKMREIPMKSEMSLIPESSDADVKVYHVKLSHYSRDNYLYGILCVPNRSGQFPAVLRVPGAGVAKHVGDKELARMGIITFQIGIHGIPLNLPLEVYRNLKNGALRDYMYYRKDDRDNYYYNRVFLGCVRANDFIATLPQYDGKNLAVYGGSQGGALSLVTAALDSRVKYVAAFYPALCDLGGYAHLRAGGWFGLKELTQQEKYVLRYYDVTNFARYIHIPGFYSWGYSDETCPPTSFYSAYNLIKAPKDLYLLKETGHWRYPEQNIKVNQWLKQKLYAENEK
jgi:cephalosporin-C deacetylase-like acetyl esterase